MLSISIHIIANLPVDSFGRIYLEKPSDFQQFKFARQKYFNHVGLFLQSSNDYEKYIYLTDIENIIGNGSKTFVYGINEKENIFCIKQSKQTCFTQLNNNSDWKLYEKRLTEKLINYSITFQFQQPNLFYVLGDIHYNIIRCDFKNFYINDQKISLHYYRFKTNFNQTKFPLVSNDNNTYRYYDVNHDFQSLEHLWKTGLSRCSSTSSYNPHRSQAVITNSSFC